MRQLLAMAIVALMLAVVAAPAFADNKDEARKCMLDAYKAIGRNEFDKAAEYFDKAITFDPENASIYESKGKMYALAKDPENAAEAYGKAHELDPGNVDYSSQYAFLLGARDRHEDALKVIDDTIATNPDNRLLMILKGTILNVLGNFSGAETVYKKAIELFPEDGNMYGGIGYSLVGQGRYDEAVTNLESSLKIVRDRNNWVTLGMALLRRGAEDDVKKANKILIGVVKGAPPDEHTVAALALLDKKDEMIEVLNKLMETRPSAMKMLKHNIKLQKYWTDPDFLAVVG